MDVDLPTSEQAAGLKNRERLTFGASKRPGSTQGRDCMRDERRDMSLSRLAECDLPSFGAPPALSRARGHATFTRKLSPCRIGAKESKFREKSETGRVDAAGGDITGRASQRIRGHLYSSISTRPQTECTAFRRLTFTSSTLRG
jgi:hypothetical protein